MKTFINRIWFVILSIIYVLQVLSLVIFPIALILWTFNINDNYISSYIKYTKQVFNLT